MSIDARVGWLVGVVLSGALVGGCGRVTEAGGGAGGVAGGGGGGLGNAQLEPGTAGNSGLPASTDRFAFAKSGERVLALGYASEGVAQFRTLHDQQLDFDCEFLSGPACGDLHCLPKQSVQLIFLDANCSQPATWILGQRAHVGDWVNIIQPEKECPGQGYARQTFSIAEQVYPEAIGGPGPSVYEWRGTTCGIAYPPAKSIPAVNRLIPHAESEFVAARPVTYNLGGGLHLSRLLAEDGSQITVGVANAAGEACGAQANGECAPLRANSSGPFPTLQRTRLGSGATHVDLFSSSPAAGGVSVPVAHLPEALDFLDDAGDHCEVVPAVDDTLRCAPLGPDGRYGASVWESRYWSDAACTERLRLYYPTDSELSRLRVLLYTESEKLTGVATVKVYDGPVFTSDNGVCIATVYNGVNGPLLALDAQIDASDMPLVVETTL